VEGNAMSGEARTTVYLKPHIYRALKVKSATTDRSVSEIINAAVQKALREDTIDLEALDKRRKEPVRSLESVLKNLKRDGLL
jgi:hypothetical protein